jgi:hypothetical protein
VSGALKTLPDGADPVSVKTDDGAVTNETQFLVLTTRPRLCFDEATGEVTVVTRETDPAHPESTRWSVRSMPK